MSKIHKNEVFRVLKCHLTVEETSELCDVSIAQVRKWDKGSPIPPAKRKLMELFKCADLESIGWAGWRFQHGELISPMNFRFQPQMLECMAMLYTNDDSKMIAHSGHMRAHATARTMSRRRRSFR